MLGGSSSQGCHGYLLAMPEVLKVQSLRHQLPSSYTGDEWLKSNLGRVKFQADAISDLTLKCT